MIKKSQEEIEEFFKQNGYVLIDKYKNSQTKMLCEKDGYFTKISYANLYCGKSSSIWGLNNIDNIEHNFYVIAKKKNSKAIFNKYEIIKKGNRKRIIVYMQCECGNYFHMLLDDIVGKKYICCHNCSTKKRGYNRRKNTVIDYIESFGYTVLDKNIFYTTQDYVEVEDKDGYLGFVKDSALHSGKGMAKFDIRVNKKHYIENVNLWGKLNFVEAECIGFEETQHTRQGLRFKCCCGNEFVTSISSFQNGKIRCDVCSRRVSRYENIFKNFLEKNNFKYIYQYSINQCRDILPLPFDFYIKDYDILVEIDGEGHYKPCCFNNISEENAIKVFKLTKKHDNIKNNFCIKNNKKLIRIPYTMFENNSYINFFIDSLRNNEP